MSIFRSSFQLRAGQSYISFICKNWVASMWLKWLLHWFATALNINKDLAFIILPFNADTGTTPRENNSVWEKQRIIHPLSTGEANIAYERQIAGKHSNNEFLKYCQLNWELATVELFLKKHQTKSFITFLHLHLLCLVMVWDDQGEFYQTQK